MNSENFDSQNAPVPSQNQPNQVDTSIFLTEPRAVDAGEGINWISQAWAMVKEKLGMWVLINIIFFAVILVVSMIPFINFFVSFITPILIGGIIAISEKQRKTGEVEIGLLFAGFQQKFGALFAVGAINFGISLIGGIIAIMIGGTALLSIMLEMSQGGQVSPETIMALSGSFFYIFVIMSVAGLVGAAMTWFAPALIMNHDFKVGAAISASLKAVSKNILPGILFFVVLAIIMFISAIPLGLGLLITFPIMYVGYYTSYRSLFFAQTHSNNQASQQNSIIS
ncbi:BPSS1780 family membrane protein [Providencia manganoxydans]|uniref:BPSS1780 family membrane protein n=1 Tax=Providencia manganoxydans TaxID=2923283 RepID=UPI0034E41C85